MRRWLQRRRDRKVVLEQISRIGDYRWSSFGEDPTTRLEHIHVYEEFRPEHAVTIDVIGDAVDNLLERAGLGPEPRDPDIDAAEAEGHDIIGQGFW